MNAVVAPRGVFVLEIFYLVEVLFRFLIRRFDLPTPGREREGMETGGPGADLPPLIDQDMDTTPAKT